MTPVVYDLIKLLCLFFIGSFFGWVLELFYRRCAHKKWQNPGFLLGPCLPIYGFSAIWLYFLCSRDLSFISSPFLRVLFLLFLITLSMTLIEYLTGLFFTKVMKVTLWDYSSCKWNIGGIITPVFSLAWGGIGLLYYYLLHPHIESILAYVLVRPIFLFPLGICFGIFMVDVFFSFQLVARIRAWAIRNKITVRYGIWQESMAKRAHGVGIWLMWLISIRNRIRSHHSEKSENKKENIE